LILKYHSYQEITYNVLTLNNSNITDANELSERNNLFQISWTTTQSKG